MITTVITKEDIKGALIEINDKKEINHLVNSFRLKEGDELRAVDGEFEYMCQVESVDKKSMTLKIISENKDNYSLDIEIHAGIGLLKNDKMEMVVQKLAEIGIKKLIPLKLDRSVVKLKEKKEKWDVIVKETLKQCQGVRPMEIAEVETLDSLDYSFYDLVMVPYENEEENKVGDIMRSKENIKKVLFIIGSEGGFAPEEINKLKEQKAEIVSLGKRILRAETAAIVMGGLLANEF